MKLHPEHPAIKIIRFPDGQPHIRLDTKLLEGVQDVDVTWRIRNPEELYLLACLHDALEEAELRIRDLVIPYLMAARSDRVMVPGDALGLRVVGHVLRAAMQYKNLFVLDPHSSEVFKWVFWSRTLSSDFLLAGIHADALVLPDKGSRIHANRRKEILRASREILCEKQRDMRTGDLKLVVTNPEAGIGKDVVIVDDICDGGATFLAIAEQLPGVRSLKLVVTHGIFSKGFGDLAPAFHQIICSDSYASSYPNQPSNLTIIPCNL